MRERVGERDTGHGSALLARFGHGPGPAWWHARRRGGGACDLTCPCAAERPSHAGEGEREGVGEGERERGSGRGLHAGNGGSACIAGHRGVEVLVAGREVGAAPGDER